MKGALDRKQQVDSGVGEPDTPCPVVADVDGVRLLLHARRLRGDMSLVEASRRAGLNRDELRRLEKGETSQVRFSTLAKLLFAYECTLSDLVEVERARAAVPLYADALSALAEGVPFGSDPQRRAVRRSSEYDLIHPDDEDTFATGSPEKSRHRRASIGTVHR